MKFKEGNYIILGSSPYNKAREYVGCLGKIVEAYSDVGMWPYRIYVFDKKDTDFFEEDEIKREATNDEIMVENI